MPDTEVIRLTGEAAIREAERTKRPLLQWREHVGEVAWSVGAAKRQEPEIVATFYLDLTVRARPERCECDHWQCYGDCDGDAASYITALDKWLCAWCAKLCTEEVPDGR